MNGRAWGEPEAMSFPQAANSAFSQSRACPRNFAFAASSSAWAFAPGLLLIGLGLGVMLTPSVNLVQSAFPEEKQGEISGLSRSVSNLGSSFGTAIAGTILVSNLISGNGTYVAAMIVLAVVALAGLGIATRLPSNPSQAADTDLAPSAEAALDTAV